MGSTFRIACFVALCICAGAAVAGGTATAAKSCPDVAVIGARGSGQNGKKELAETKRMGGEVFAIAKTLRSKLEADGESVKLLGVPYEAASVDVLKSGNLDKYTKSIEEGARMTRDQVVTWAYSCEETDLVLVGYSQGAIAIHRALLILQAENDPTALDSLLGAIVLADGDRVPTTQAKHFGSSKDDASGVRTYLHASDERDFPDPEVVVDICDKQDIVCDFNATNARTNAKAGAAVHTGYLKRDGGKLLRRAAGWFYREFLGE